MMRSLTRWKWLAGLAILLLVAGIAKAAPGEIFDNTNQLYKTAAAGWYASAHAMAVSLFWKLAAIELAWSTISWVLAEQEQKAFIAAVVKKLLSIGFFYWILSTADYWIPAVVNGLTQVGTQAGGVAALSPSEVVSVGLDGGWQLVKSLNKLGLVEAVGMGIPVTLIAVLIVFSFSVVGAQLLIAMIESYVVMGVGVFFLGFNGARWTTDFGQKFIGYAVGTGVKLMMTYLIIAVGMSITDQFSDLLNSTKAGDNLLSNALTIMSASMIFAFLCWSIPKTAAALMSGAPALTAGGAVTAGVGMAAGAIAGGAMLAQAGKGVVSAAMNAAKGGGSGAARMGLSSSMQTAAAGNSPGGSAVGGLSGSVNTVEKGGASLSAMPSATSSSAGSGSTAQSAARGTVSDGDKPMRTVSPPQVADGDLSTTRQASDTMQDNAPAKLGSAAPQKAATNQSTANTSADSGNKSAGAGAAGGSQARTRQASDTMQDNAPARLGSAAAQSTATNTAASASEPNAIASAAVGPPTKDQSPSRVDRALDKLTQVRPPQVPNDEAGGGTVHVRMDMGGD